MDLNEKIAARRRELEIQAEKTRLADVARQKEDALKIEQKKKAEKAAIDAAVAKRFAEKGIAHQPVEESPSSPQVSGSDVDAEFEKALSAAASARMKGGESAKFFILLLMGLGGFFVTWWIGLAFIIWAFSYLTKTTNRHKEEIIAEGKSKICSETAYSATLVAVGERKNEVIEVTRAVTGLGINDSKDLVESLPKAVITGVSKLEAESIHKQFADVGAIIEINPR